MRKVFPLLFAVVFFLLPGCGLWPYIGPGESPVDRLEKQCRYLQNELEKVRKAENDNSADRRRQYAEIKVGLDAMRSEVQGLRGEIERISFSLDQHIREYESRQRPPVRPAAEVTLPEPGLPAESTAEGAMSGEPENEAGVTVGRNHSRPDEMSEDDLYVAGRQLLDAADYADARETFERFLKLYPESKQSDNAYFWIGEAYFRQSAYEKAILSYQEVIDKFPKGNKVPSALLKQGMAFDRIGDDINARLVLKRLVRDFPDSREAGDARRLLQEL